MQIDVTGTISNTDLGSKTTENSAARFDVVGTASGTITGVLTGLYSGGIFTLGHHNHNIVLGSHGHTLTDAKTAALGSGTQLNVTNEYITLAAWYRVS